MLKPIAFTAAVLASLHAADAFALNASPLRTTAVRPLVSSVSLPRLRAAGVVGNVRMAQVVQLPPSVPRAPCCPVPVRWSPVLPAPV